VPRFAKANRPRGRERGKEAAVRREEAVEARRLFEKRFGRQAVAAAQAPGRVNLIGEHTDYNGGRVLPVAIALATEVAVRPRADARVVGISREEGPAEAGFADPPRHHWLDYPRGIARLLAEAGRVPASGFELAVASDVPPGAGLSSSAALEVATALALMAAAGAPLLAAERAELARLCQRAEGEFAGVPCGIMDPYAILHARPGCAVLLRCDVVRAEAVPVPASVELLVVDTGVRHSLRSGDYAERRRECDEALAAARTALGRDLATLSDVAVRDLPAVRPALPDLLFRRLRHVVTENARVLSFARALRDRDVRGAGELLYASHASLRSDFEVSCAESDLLVDASRSAPGCLGARMTGAGFGGSTLHWVEVEAGEAAASALAAAFRARFGRTPRSWRTRPSAGASVE
jgi:galactokinase